ncbi:MAG: tRNA (N6-threonylcarbamoyladenosine(37)-N6)-methyltransferase TrmO [Oscillospiraceae bacterium]|nr:tRNA (N6-threonylcarbamoyladenosine(37)-N6)-methyltransferase TrmO [Oscillospiraceae bacterium]
MTPIAHIRNDFTSKFGIPRQSGIIPELKAQIVFTAEFSRMEAVRGLEAFSHIWLLWEFSEAKKPDGKGWSATVRPPRLGGNQRVGVFATRSPFRPNPIGLSCVKLEGIRQENGTVILDVCGADLLDGTPIYDIKPYIPFTDCHPEASEGYTAETRRHLLTVCDAEHLLEKLPAEKQKAAEAILAQDPRPGYSDDKERVFGVPFAEYDIRFRVDGEQLTVCEVVKME